MNTERLTGRNAKMSVLSHKDAFHEGATFLERSAPNISLGHCLRDSSQLCPEFELLRFRALKISAADLGFQGSGIQALRSRQLLWQKNPTPSPSFPGQLRTGKPHKSCKVLEEKNPEPWTQICPMALC